MEPPHDQSSSSEHEYFPQHTQGLTLELEPEQIAENVIMNACLEEEKNQRATRALSEDVEFKLEEVLDEIRDQDSKNFQTIITLRMKQLAYNKILVLTYQKSYFRLVQALFHIGKEYLKFDCLEQATTHIENAISKNVRASQNSVNKLYHSFLLSTLGECNYRQGRNSQALDELVRACNLQEEYEKIEKTEVNNVKTLVCLAKVKAELGHQDSMQILDSAIKKAAELKSERSRLYGLALRDKAVMFRTNGQFTESIQYYQKAIQAIKMSNQNRCEEDIIAIYKVLYELYEQSNNVQKAIKTLRENYQLFEDTYGNADKQAIRQQRTLATALLKHKKIDDSLEEFDDILQKQQKVYGQNSLEVGKQYKTIASIFTAKGDYKSAEVDYKKAIKIFHDLGEQRLVRQVRVKLSAIQSHLI